MTSDPILHADVFDAEAFEGVEVVEGAIVRKSFSRCTFDDCRFFETRFEACRFERCVFRGCDLSMARVQDCIWLGVTFEKCKLMGINWTLSKDLHVLDVDFVDSVLTYGSFMGMDLRDVTFQKCVAREANFGEADLSGVVFADTDLKGAEFLHTNLSGVDFRSARHYAIHPPDNKVKGAKFSFPEAISLLRSFEVEIEFGGEEDVSSR